MEARQLDPSALPHDLAQVIARGRADHARAAQSDRTGSLASGCGRVGLGDCRQESCDHVEVVRINVGESPLDSLVDRLVLASQLGRGASMEADHATSSVALVWSSFCVPSSDESVDRCRDRSAGQAELSAELARCQAIRSQPKAVDRLKVGRIETQLRSDIALEDVAAHSDRAQTLMD